MVAEIPAHTPEIVLYIAKTPRSFNQIQFAFRLSPSTLSRALKLLKRTGCIDKKVLMTETRGPKAEYFLTEKGRRLVPSMKRIVNGKKEALVFLAD